MSLEIILGVLGAGAAFGYGCSNGYHMGQKLEINELIHEMISAGCNVKQNLIDEYRKTERESKNQPYKALSASGAASILHYLATQNLGRATFNTFVSSYFSFFLGNKLGRYFGRKKAKQNFQYLKSYFGSIMKNLYLSIASGREPPIDYLIEIDNHVVRKSRDAGSWVYAEYFREQFRHVFDKAYTFNQVRNFVENEIHDNRFKVAIIGNPRFAKGYMFMFENDKIIKARAEMGNLNINFESTDIDEVQMNFQLVGAILYEDVVDWKGDVEDFVNEIQQKKQDYTVIIGAGGEHFPRKDRLGKAALRAAFDHHLWRKRNREK